MYFYFYKSEIKVSLIYLFRKRKRQKGVNYYSDFTITEEAMDHITRDRFESYQN